MASASDLWSRRESGRVLAESRASRTVVPQRKIGGLSLPGVEATTDLNSPLARDAPLAPPQPLRHQGHIAEAVAVAGCAVRRRGLGRTGAPAGIASGQNL